MYSAKNNTLIVVLKQKAMEASNGSPPKTNLYNSERNNTALRQKIRETIDEEPRKINFKNLTNSNTLVLSKQKGIEPHDEGPINTNFDNIQYSK
jgi:hypothetical protein